MSVLRSAALVMSIAMALTACSGTAEDATDTSGVEGGSEDEVTLDLWIFEGEEAFLPTLKERFEAENPSIGVEITEIPEDGYITKIDTALAAGAPPDIGFVGTNFEPRWLKAGHVEPLDTMISAEGIDVAAFNQSALSGCVFEGSTYCLGSETGAVLLFYNKDLFDAAGLTYPSASKPLTIDEYAELARELTVHSDDPEEHVFGGFAVGVAGAPQWWMDWRAHFSEDGAETVGYANDESTVHLYDVLASLVRDRSAPTGSDAQIFQDVDLLATGRLAMSLEDNFVAIPTLEQAGIKWGAAPPPVETAGQEAWIPAWTDQWGVFSSSDDVEAAQAFVAFVATEGNRLRVELADHYPLDSSIPEAEAWASESDARTEVVSTINLARPSIFVPGFWDVTASLADAFSGIVQEDMTAQEALDEAAEIMQERLDLAWETWNNLE